MNLRLREFTTQDPTLVEALAWTGRNLLFCAVPVIELYGDINRDGELMEKGLGVLAIGGICEVIRRAENRIRQSSESPENA